MIAATPVLERLGSRPARVVGAGREAAYVEDHGFVAILTTTRPLLPNGIQVARLPAVGDELVLDGEPWDPTVRLPADPAVLGKDILAALGPHDLVETGEAAFAGASGAALVGRGPGLTPEGDDLLAGAAAVLAAAGSRDFVAALLGTDLRARTTSLSATLFELAARGKGPEPLQALLTSEPGALARLLTLGHSTGRAYALGAALALTRVV